MPNAAASPPPLSLSPLDTAQEAPSPCTQGQGMCCTGQETLLDTEEADRLAEVFKAVADPTRVRLLAHIASTEHGTACACHLPDALGISQPTLSHHMKKLVTSGLVTREQRGRWAHYTLAPDALSEIEGFLAGVRMRSEIGPTRR